MKTEAKLKEEITKILKRNIDNGRSPLDVEFIFNRLKPTLINDLVFLFSQLRQDTIREVEGIIGEDEQPEEYIAKHLTEQELSMAHKAVQFHARNGLREEQRQKLSKFTLSENSKEKGG